MQKDDLLNELIRQVAQACMVCRYGKANMKCIRKSCYKKQVRDNLKKIEKLNKEGL